MRKSLYDIIKDFHESNAPRLNHGKYVILQIRDGFVTEKYKVLYNITGRSESELVFSDVESELELLQVAIIRIPGKDFYYVPVYADWSFNHARTYSDSAQYEILDA